MIETELAWTEKKFSSEVQKLVKLYGGIYYLTVRPKYSPAGYPDLTIVAGKRVIFAELKTETGQLIRGKWKGQIVGGTWILGQDDWLNTLAEAHEEVYLWRPRHLDEISAILSGRVRGLEAKSHWQWAA